MTIDPNDITNIPEGPTVKGPQFNVRRVDPSQEPAAVAEPTATTEESVAPNREQAPRIDEKQRVVIPSTGSGYVRRPKLDWAEGAAKVAAQYEEQLRLQNQAQVERESGNQGLKRIRELEDKVEWLEQNLITLMERVESGLTKQSELETVND